VEAFYMFIAPDAPLSTTKPLFGFPTNYFRKTCQFPWSRRMSQICALVTDRCRDSVC